MRFISLIVFSPGHAFKIDQSFTSVERQLILTSIQKLLLWKINVFLFTWQLVRFKKKTRGLGGGGGGLNLNLIPGN